MKRNPLLALLAALLLPVGLHANDNVSKSTRDFVQTASIVGHFEVESSKLALDKTKKTEIRKFAETMIEDHTKAGEALKATLPDTGTGLKPVEALDSKHQKIMDNLKGLHGDAFDKEYVSVQKKAHDDAVALFSDYSKNGDSLQLKEFAANTLPTLERHRDHVKELKAAD